MCLNKRQKYIIRLISIYRITATIIFSWKDCFFVFSFSTFNFQLRSPQKKITHLFMIFRVLSFGFHPSRLMTWDLYETNTFLFIRITRDLNEISFAILLLIFFGWKRSKKLEYFKIITFRLLLKLLDFLGDIIWIGDYLLLLFKHVYSSDLHITIRYLHPSPTQDGKKFPI